MTEAPTDGPSPRSADFVQSLERGLAVIKAFDADDRSLTLSDVARKTGLTRAAARRFLHTLAELGYVRTDGRFFSLRPAVLELGYAYLSGLSLPEVAHPHMEELTARLHESTSISVLDGTSVVYVARVAAKRIMTVGINVGTRFPAHATSMGRVLLAHAPADWLRDLPRDRRPAADHPADRHRPRHAPGGPGAGPPRRLRRRRPGAGARAALARRAAARPARAGGRRDERVDPRQPRQHRGDRARPAAAAAGDRRGDRGGPADPGLTVGAGRSAVGPCRAARARSAQRQARVVLGQALRRRHGDDVT